MRDALGGKSSAPKTDPAVEEANRIERERAEADRLKATQQQLAQETVTNSARFGRRSLLSAGPGGFSPVRSLLGG
ncbi:hypothetical protein [Azospirillum argentinense]|uniref:Uncharacterized protein n=1 Tax=Azospirillum argentinense TaxID=2970906 RepID=A0A5B0KZ85_9PROT|nr:hypothetical protein FH063_001334 [Azospirillum argentinense]